MHKYFGDGSALQYLRHCIRFVPQSANMNPLTSPSEEPLLTLTFGDLLDQAAVSWPDRDAYVFFPTGSRVTFAGLKEQVDRLAGGLLAIGIGRGDHVGWVAGNRPEWMVIFLAVMKIGAVAVPLDLCFFQYGETVIHVLNKAEIKVLIVEASEDKSTPFHDMFGTTEGVERGALAVDRVPHLTTLVTIGETNHQECQTLTELMQKGGHEEFHERLAKLQNQLSCHDPAILQFTSGITGVPKAVQQTTYSILNSNRYVALALHMDQQCIAAFPTLFCNIAWGTCLPIIVGCTFVVPTTKEVETILSAIQEEKCTMIHPLYVKTFYNILHYPGLQGFDLSSLKQVITGGNMVSKALITTSSQVLPHVTVIILYGSTEVCFVTCTLPEMTSEAQNSTVGAVLPHIQLKIADDDGNSVPRNTVGEVVIRGYSVFQQYYADTAKTAAAKKHDGWFSMGDMGFIGDDGLLRITGRKTVVGVPDAVNGEELCACIILKSRESVGEEEMKQFAKKRGLVEEFCPRYILFVESFPNTSNGRKVRCRQKEAEKRRYATLGAERTGRVKIE
ncbi:medium-chain acyl-CoA ligase ACSF2, mitochondrial-like isoform X3 [Branchiostoma lanceolatum]|uniref:medium-chain acyl-CoA ligase ACSF2, mitochondrial-like isoform X3 n=1 Tax=Branchiostoma lanceolatum TaxID=7740 RepID=UPI003454A146